MTPDVVNSIAAWIGLVGLIPSVLTTLIYGLTNHAVWRKSALGRVMFVLFLAMSLVYIVFLTQKIVGHGTLWYPFFSLAVFALLMCAMWSVLFVVIHEQIQGEMERQPGQIIVKKATHKK